MKLPVLAEFPMDTTFLYGHLASKTSNKLQPKSLYLTQEVSYLYLVEHTILRFGMAQSCYLKD